MERTGTKKPQAGAAQKVANPFEAVIKANPELAAILSGAINGTGNALNNVIRGEGLGQDMIHGLDGGANLG